MRLLILQRKGAIEIAPFFMLDIFSVLWGVHYKCQQLANTPKYLLFFHQLIKNWYQGGGRPGGVFIDNTSSFIHDHVPGDALDIISIAQ